MHAQDMIVTIVAKYIAV